MYRITVSCGIVCNNKLLLVREMQNGKISWDIPAGGVEINENIEEAIKREVREEAGISTVNPILKRVYIYYEKDDITTNFLFLAELSPKSNLFTPESDVIKSVKWFNSDEVKYIIKTNQYEHKLAKERLVDILAGIPDPLIVKEIREE